MRQVSLVVGSVLLALSLLAGFGRAPVARADSLVPAVASTQFGAAVTLDGYEQHVLGLLLAARQAHGLSTPRLDATLAGVARTRSGDMAGRGYFSHYTPEGATFFDLLDTFGVPWQVAGETLARNNYADGQTAAVAAQRLLTSPPHRAVILDPQYNTVGIGHATDGHGMHYYAVIFVRQ